MKHTRCQDGTVIMTTPKDVALDANGNPITLGDGSGIGSSAKFADHHKKHMELRRAIGTYICICICIGDLLRRKKRRSKG